MAKKKAAKKAAVKKQSKKVAQAKKPLKAKTAKKPVKKAKPLPETLLKAGDTAPSFTLLNENGETVSLSSHRGKKVILYFYPKDSTPGCTQESCDFRDNFARVKSKGAVVYGISRDSVKSHQKFQSKYSFPFSLLSDEDGRVCEAYGVWKEKNLYGRKYMGIERTTFLIDGTGKVQKVYPKVKVTGHVDEVIGDLS